MCRGALFVQVSEGEVGAFGSCSVELVFAPEDASSHREEFLLTFSHPSLQPVSSCTICGILTVLPIPTGTVYGVQIHVQLQYTQNIMFTDTQNIIRTQNIMFTDTQDVLGIIIISALGVSLSTSHVFM